MAILHDKLPLRAATPATWLPEVQKDFDAFLQDHASCERKAAGLAMSFVGKYPDKEVLLEPMICLAKEEWNHFHEVYRLMHRRGVPLLANDKDPYVVKLLSHVRHGKDEHLLDRLLMAALIEARSCERFQILAEGLEDADLAAFYARLSREEAGHYMIFLRIARHYYGEVEIQRRLDELLDKEADAMLTAPLRCAVH